MAVWKGVVTLTGSVESFGKKWAAGEIAHRVAGALDVANDIQVTLPGTGKKRRGHRSGVRHMTVKERNVQPAEIRKKIEEALERRADREAERIAVKVADGTVTLTGRVRSWGEKEAVLGTVSHAPGVRRVHDELRVEPFF